VLRIDVGSSGMLSAHPPAGRRRVDLGIVIPLLVIAAAAVISFVGPIFWGFKPNEVDADSILDGMSWTHPLGTDELGRDVLARLMAAAKVSMGAVVISVTVSLVVGLVPGLAAGYFGGRLDRAVTRVVDIVVTMPAFVVAITVVALLGPGLTNAMVAAGIVLAPRVIRVARSCVLSLREDTFVEAAKVLGGTDWWIVRRHILPNVLGPLLVVLSTLAAYSMFLEAGLSFLGLGVQPPQASLGAMVKLGVPHLSADPRLVYAPGVVIACLVLACNHLGDRLSHRRHGRR